MTDNSAVVGQIKNQGGTCSRVLSDLTSDLLLWTQEHGVSRQARHIPGARNTMRTLSAGKELFLQ